MIALGAIMTGQFKGGKQIIDRLIDIFIDFRGRTSGEGEWYIYTKQS
ncbi:hypothetical protein J7M02_05035 [Candidatus Aerophobetes bacterium]|nr:hypothetical protein [Candidatus Aerophobetes bacterium]